MDGKHLKTVLVIAALLLAGFYNVMVRPWMLDDAFISYRYAENLASGKGLVFNPGERVEGYTTFLWVVLLALGKRLGAHLPFFSQLLGIAFAAGTLILVSQARRFIPHLDSWTPKRATLFLASNAAFSAWAMTGMEVMLFTFEVTFLTLFYLALKQSAAGKWRWTLLGLLGAATAMTRPEGILVFGLISADAAIDGIRRRNGTGMTALLAFAFTYGPYYLWRWLHFGFLFPNTFYAKVGLSWEQAARGFYYLESFLFPAALLAFLFLNFCVALSEFQSLRRLYLIPVLIGLYTLYIIAVGGDVWAAFRFFTPLLPLLCLGASLSLEMYVEKKAIGRSTALFLSILVIVWNVFQFQTNRFLYPKIMRDQSAAHGVVVGRWLRTHVPAHALLAANTAGSVPYTSKLRTIDMLGINDLHIAHKKIVTMGQGLAGHEKGDGAYVLSRKPDYIMLGPSLGSPHPWPGFIGDDEIFRNPAFHHLYKLEKISLKTGETFFIFKKVHGSSP